MPDNIKEKKEMVDEVPEECAADNDTQLEEMEKVEEGKVKEMAVQEKLNEVITVKEVVDEGPTGVVSATQSGDKEKDDQLTLSGEAQVDLGQSNGEGSLSGSKSPSDTTTTEGELKRKLDLQNEATIEKEIPLKKLKSDEGGDSGDGVNQNSIPKEDNNKEEEAGEKAEQQDVEMADGH